MESLFIYLWKSALIVALFYGFYRFLLNKETYFQSIRYFLVSGIIIAFTLPLLIIPIYTEPVQLTQFITGTIINTTTPTIISKPSIDWMLLLFYIYTIITAGLFIRFVFQLISIASIIFKNKSTKVGNYYYVETNDETSPFSFFNFIIYNQTLFNETELTQIIAHEKIHAIQKHSFDTLLSNLLIITQWYNPFAWLYKKDIEQNLEFIADEYAQKQANSNQSYQQLLLKTSIPNYQMALANNFYNSLLKKRIIMLHKKRSNHKSQWKIALIAPFLLVFLFTFNTKIIAQQKKNDKKIVKITAEVYAMGISKNSSIDELKEITKNFKEKGLTVKFSEVKRNNDSEIIAIKISAKADSGRASASYSANDSTKGITSIQISFDNENNNLSIGSSDGHNMYRYSFSNNGHRKMIKHRGHSNSNTVVIHSDDDDTHSSTKIWVNKNGDTTKIKKMVIDIEENYNGEGIHEIIIDDEEGTETEIIKIKNKKGDSKGNFIFISDDDDDKNTITTYIVNGKKMSKEEFKKFDKVKIKTIEIIKEAKKEK